MKCVAKRPRSLTSDEFHYCPGCSHGIIHRLIASVIDELEIGGQTIGIAPVGCSVLAYQYFDLDMQEAAHGRAPAVGTGIKRVLPQGMVFTYQGDGDLASIGTGEIIHAAARGENITTFFVNNAIYGMTGGQMAPTTLLGQKTTTSPTGRERKVAGLPIRVAELLSTIDGSAYIARVSLHNPREVRKAQKAVKKAFLTQMREEGFSLVEFLATCPTNWGLSPQEALDFVEDHMIPAYPLGVFRDTTDGEGENHV